MKNESFCSHVISQVDLRYELEAWISRVLELFYGRFLASIGRSYSADMHAFYLQLADEREDVGDALDLPESFSKLTHRPLHAKLRAFFEEHGLDAQAFHRLYKYTNLQCARHSARVQTDLQVDYWCAQIRDFFGPSTPLVDDVKKLV